MLNKFRFVQEVESNQGQLILVLVKKTRQQKSVEKPDLTFQKVGLGFTSRSGRLVVKLTNINYQYKQAQVLGKFRFAQVFESE